MKNFLIFILLFVSVLSVNSYTNYGSGEFETSKIMFYASDYGLNEMSLYEVDFFAWHDTKFSRKHVDFFKDYDEECHILQIYDPVDYVEYNILYEIVNQNDINDLVWRYLRIWKNLGNKAYTDDIKYAAKKCHDIICEYIINNKREYTCFPKLEEITKNGKVEFVVLRKDKYEKVYSAQELYYAEKYKEAFRIFKRTAEQGDASYQSTLGHMYYYGQGVEQNYAEAVKWYTKSAEQGNASAQYNLGLMYAEGQGVEQNYEEAVKWYTKSAEQGYARAQCNLGVMYYKGDGVEQNYAEAVKWYTKSAEQGNAIAQCNLGFCYEFGQGCEQDYAKAIEWYTKSAEQGYAYAQEKYENLKSKLNIKDETDDM